MMTHYAILLTFDGEGPGFAVSVPALPGCFTQGATVPEAIERAREAISGHVAALRELGEEVPTGGALALLTVVEVEMPAAQAG